MRFTLSLCDCTSEAKLCLRCSAAPQLQLAAVLPAGIRYRLPLTLRVLHATSPGYVEAVREVVTALTDTITFEASGASEREVRRRADPAKASIERFLRDWKGSPLVSGQPSYVALVGASLASDALLSGSQGAQTRCGSSAHFMLRAAHGRPSRRTCATRCWLRCVTPMQLYILRLCELSSPARRTQTFSHAMHCACVLDDGF